MSSLKFFPTPYPDEILYSVFCRYNARCGNPSATRASITLFDQMYGKNLFLPDKIEIIASQVPEAANLTAERLIEETTIFPFLKPFLYKSKIDSLLYSMRFGNPKILNMLGLRRNQTLSPQYLRYCRECLRDDVLKYGEPYWHRLHQMPGVSVCSKHTVPLLESNVDTAEIKYGYYPLIPQSSEYQLLFESDTATKMTAFSCDVEWLLANGRHLSGYEQTLELYDCWMRDSGFRSHNGITSYQKLNKDLVEYYGYGFLSLFRAYNSGVCTWLRNIVQIQQRLTHPLYHLLLMRFLAGSAEEFFTAKRERIAEHLPFGKPPYPCRNHICEHNLLDVIEHIEVRIVNGKPWASFVCPYCGLSYRRVGSVPKDKQYSGHIHIDDYGEKWQNRLVELLSAGTPVYKITRILHCCSYTVLKFGAGFGFFSRDKAKRKSRKYYVPKGLSLPIKQDIEIKRQQYRRQLLLIMSEKPYATRCELYYAATHCNYWLRKHDLEWYEQNAPPSRKSRPAWMDCDDEYAERIKEVTDRVRASNEQPLRLSVNYISRTTRIKNLSIKLASGYLPKSKAIIDAQVETAEQWRKRKIRWSERQLRMQEAPITKAKIKRAASVYDPEGKFDDYINELLFTNSNQ